MMKKLLILMLVLGLASIANAGTVSITGPADITCGTTETYNVVYSGSPDIISFDIDVGPSGECLATMGNVVILAAGRNPDYDYIGPPAVLPDGYEVSASADAGALGSPWFSFDLTAPVDCEYCTYVTLTPLLHAIYDTGWNDVTGTTGAVALDVHCIPEPMTIALLGLGGLFLRRRK